jgi:hypothetical protein
MKQRGFCRSRRTLFSPQRSQSKTGCFHRFDQSTNRFCLLVKCEMPLPATGLIAGRRKSPALEFVQQPCHRRSIKRYGRVPEPSRPIPISHRRPPTSTRAPGRRCCGRRRKVVEPATVTDGSGGSTPSPTKMDQGDAAATFTALANTASATAESPPVQCTLAGSCW